MSEGPPVAPDDERALRRNIPKLMLLNGSWMFLVVIPVVVPFYKSHGLSMQEIYWLSGKTPWRFEYSLPHQRLQR